MMQMNLNPAGTCNPLTSVIDLTGRASPFVPDPITGAGKNDSKKNQLELLPFEALTVVGDVLTYGAAKYSPDNWYPGMSWRRVLGSGLRHLFAWAQGENIDPESKLPHLGHAACCILFLISYEQRKVGTDDRRKYV